MTNGQRPANPHRFAIWRSKPFPDGTPAKAEFSINCFIPLDVIRSLYDAIASGVIQPEQDRNGVPGVTLWGNGFRGTGAPTANGGTSPVMSGSFNTHKAIWQAQQAVQQQQVAPAMAPLPAGTFPQRHDDMTRALTPEELAAVRAYQQQQQVQQGWGAPQAAPAANQWASEPPAF
jgi:hypothetical protein